jgi:acetolactate synthase-1/2/3 large subunit
MDLDAIEKSIALMRQARRPLIVVGWGAQHASAQVRQLAERLQAPVIAHRMGHGVLDGRHPLSVNVVAGHRLWKDADLVIGVGTRLQMQQAIWGTHPSRRVIRIDADPEELDRIRVPDAGVIGDAAAILDALLADLPVATPDEARASRIAQVKAEAAARLEVLRPQIDFLCAIRSELTDDGIFIDELTQIGYVSRLTLPVYQPRTFLSPGYQGTLGWAVATAIGAKVAKPHAPVIAVSGDGGFLFNVQELATAVQHDIPIVVVVFNDGAYGNVRRTQAVDFQGRFIATELRNPDFVALAQSFGALGLRASSASQLRMVLRQALDANRPAVIEVPMQDMPDPWPFLKLGPTGPPGET